jgi:hypothetical protein
LRTSRVSLWFVADSGIGGARTLLDVHVWPGYSVDGGLNQQVTLLTYVFPISSTELPLLDSTELQSWLTADQLKQLAAREPRELLLLETFTYRLLDCSTRSTTSKFVIDLGACDAVPAAADEFSVRLATTRLHTVHPASLKDPLRLPGALSTIEITFPLVMEDAVIQFCDCMNISRGGASGGPTIELEGRVGGDKFYEQFVHSHAVHFKRLNAVKTRGDGHCLLGAAAMSLSPTYRALSPDDQTRFNVFLRRCIVLPLSAFSDVARVADNARYLETPEIGVVGRVVDYRALLFSVLHGVPFIDDLDAELADGDDRPWLIYDNVGTNPALGAHAAEQGSHFRAGVYVPEGRHNDPSSWMFLLSGTSGKFIVEHYGGIEQAQRRVGIDPATIVFGDLELGAIVRLTAAGASLLTNPRPGELWRVLDCFFAPGPDAGTRLVTRVALVACDSDGRVLTAAGTATDATVTDTALSMRLPTVCQNFMLARREEWQMPVDGTEILDENLPFAVPVDAVELVG